MFRRQVLDHRHAEISQAGIIAIRIDDKRFDLRFDPSDDMGNDSAGAAEDEAAAKEMGAEIPEPSEGIEQKIKEKMQQMDPYKVFHNE